MTEERKKILISYAEWTAIAAIRSGKHIKETKIIQEALREIYLGNIPTTQADFDVWHEEQCKLLREKIVSLAAKQERITKNFELGWAAKILNIYLKTLFYIGDMEPSVVRQFIHPPIDNIFVNAFYKEHKVRVAASDFRIKKLEHYLDYAAIINSIKAIQKEKKFLNLMDVENIWGVGTTADELIDENS